MVDGKGRERAERLTTWSKTSWVEFQRGERAWCKTSIKPLNQSVLRPLGQKPIYTTGGATITGRITSQSYKIEILQNLYNVTITFKRVSLTFRQHSTFT
jgi:hypothetical protein